jgi:hypothetical protein
VPIGRVQLQEHSFLRVPLSAASSRSSKSARAPKVLIPPFLGQTARRVPMRARIATGAGRHRLEAAPVPAGRACRPRPPVSAARGSPKKPECSSTRGHSPPFAPPRRAGTPPAGRLGPFSSSGTVAVLRSRAPAPLHPPGRVDFAARRTQSFAVDQNQPPALSG